MAEILPGYDINSWGGICGPAGLPPPMVEKLKALAKKALESDDVKKAYLKNGATPLWMSAGRHRRLPPRRERRAGADDQGERREGRLIAPAIASAPEAARICSSASLYNVRIASLGFRHQKAYIQGGVAMVRVLVPRRRALAVMGGALATPYVASGVARAGDDWPNRPVKYINLFPAGGATDVLSRMVCQQLSELTGQQFVVENKGGSGGNVGADAIAKSPNDGYTVGLDEHREPRDLADALRQAAVRCREGLHADQHAVAGAQHLRRQARHPGEDGAGAGRAGEGQSRQVHLRLRRIGHQPASSAARC